MLGSSHEGPEAADPALALMDEVGAALREARRERGKEILDVAEILRIQPAYLAALEQGDLAAIPGRTYALGFLRSYAQYLGFDGEDMIAQIKSSVDLAGGAALQGRAPLTESRLPKIPILVISLATLAGAYAGWAYVESGKAPAELVEEVPDDLRKDARSLFEAGLQATPPASLRREAPDAIPAVRPPPAEASDAIPALAPNRLVARPQAPVAAPPAAPDASSMAPDTPPRAEPQASLTPSAGPTLAAAQDPVPPHPAALAPAADLAGETLGGQAAIPAIAVAAEADRTTGQSLEPPRQAALAPAAQPPEVEPARGPRAYGTPSPESRVVLRARDRAWVHVSSTHNDYLWVQTLRPGDTFMVPARPDLVLWTGNAGGVEVLVDGALLPPLGPDAVVVRDVSLQPRALLRRLLPLPAEDGGVSDLASAAKPPMMPPSSR